MYASLRAHPFPLDRDFKCEELSEEFRECYVASTMARTLSRERNGAESQRTTCTGGDDGSIAARNENRGGVAGAIASEKGSLRRGEGRD